MCKTVIVMNNDPFLVRDDSSFNEKTCILQGRSMNSILKDSSAHILYLMIHATYPVNIFYNHNLNKPQKLCDYAVSFRYYLVWKQY